MNVLTVGRLLLAGTLATLTMDISAGLGRKLGLTHGISPELIGRWFAYLARGQVHHDSIALTPAVKGELPLALICHYLIGISLTAAFWTVLHFWSIRPSGGVGFASALGFGLLTNVLPWLLMFPAMGYDFFGSGAPSEWLLLRTSFVNHVFFGLGLGLATRFLGGWIR